MVVSGRVTLTSPRPPRPPVPPKVRIVGGSDRAEGLFGDSGERAWKRGERPPPRGLPVRGMVAERGVPVRGGVCCLLLTGGSGVDARQWMHSGRHLEASSTVPQTISFSGRRHLQ